MIYGYECRACSFTTDVIKSVQFYDRDERCPSCQETMFKVICSPIFSVDKTQPEYNPAFGKIIKNRYHRKEETKKRGWIEVGNESPDKMSKTFESQRETIRKKRWEEV